MKKWWIGFAILLLALLSSSAMAEDISFGFCDRCNQMRVFVFVRMQYSSPEYHVKIIKCTTCSSEKESDQISHTASIAALPQASKTSAFVIRRPIAMRAIATMATRCLITGAGGIDTMIRIILGTAEAAENSLFRGTSPA